MPKIFSVLDKIKPVYDIAEKVMMIICKLLLIADILVTCYMVIGRYIPFQPSRLTRGETLPTPSLAMAAAISGRKASPGSTSFHCPPSFA